MARDRVRKKGLPLPKEMPRILFLGVNYRYINPTNSLIPSILAGISKLYFFGPGFVSQSMIDDGIDRFVEGIGGVDLIVTTTQIASGVSWEANQSFLSRYAVMLNGGALSESFLVDAGRFLFLHRLRTICFLTDLDPHAVQPQRLEELDKHAEFFVCWGSDFLSALDHSADLVREDYYQKKKGRFVFGEFDKFIKKNGHRVITLGHMVCASEFYWAGLSGRRYDVAVPGINYARRKDAIDILRHKPNIHMSYSRYRQVFKIIDYFGLRPFSSHLGVQIYNEAFRSQLYRSKLCITDGGGNNFPVRKFLEIPAAGSLLACWPATGFDRLGFVDGENYVDLSKAGDLVDCIQAILANIETWEAVAMAGRNLVFRNHTTSARSDQLARAITRIRQGDYQGSSWVAGEFICLSRDLPTS